jgi:hypothetical protein
MVTTTVFTIFKGEYQSDEEMTKTIQDLESRRGRLVSLAVVTHPKPGASTLYEYIGVFQG